jgi:hypothetical protein
LTLFLTLGIFGIPILLLALNIPTFVSSPGTSYPPNAGWLYVTAGYLILAAAFSIVVWFMLVRDAGNKIPPSVMLAIGVIGFITYTLHLLGAIPFSTISLVVISPETIFLSWLFITFGVAGLLTKRQAS